MTAVPDAEALARVVDGTSAMIRTVDGLGEDRLRAPSLLPGWSRAHVVAHLALNGEGLAAVLDGLAHEEAVPMYASNARRDADIEELAAAPVTDLRERLLAACSAFADAVPRVPAAAWSTAVERTPGGPTFPAGEILAMRRREVEIHHADLDAGVDHTVWPGDFTLDLLDVVTLDREPDGPFRVRADDLGREWAVGRDGSDGPTVAGAGTALAWWLTGRGNAGGLTVDGGALPRLGPWRRSPSAPASGR